MIRTRRILSATLFARALFSLTLLSAVEACARQDKPTPEQLKEAKDVKEAKDAFAKLGATYEGPTKPRAKPPFHIYLYPPPPSAFTEPGTKRTVHRFRMPPGTEDRDLNVLPNPPFAFELDLSGTKLTDAGLKELAPLKNLTTLLLPGSVTDATLRALREVGLLHTLGLGKVGRPTKLEEVIWLSLPSTVTAAGLKELAPLKNLTTLSLPKGVTDAGLKELAPLQSLTTLHLLDTKVTDAGLKELAALKNLTTLDLRGTTKVSDKGVETLQQALPKCKILR
jgi:hypothetical protein